MMNRKILYLFIFFLITPLINASTETDWLLLKSDNGTWQNNFDTSLSLLALNGKVANSKLLSGADSLKNYLDSCLSTSTCNIKDVAISLWALNVMSQSTETISKGGSWLLESSSIEFTGVSEGVWKVQIVSSTDINGVCSLYDPSSADNVQYINLEGKYTPWQDITILTSSTKNLILNCSALPTSNLILSLIHQVDNNFYILKEERNKNSVNLEFGIPCWGISYKNGVCDQEITAYVLFVLNKLGKSSDPTWLRNKADLTPLQNALLYETTSDTKYLDKLNISQNSAGFWGAASVYDTAMIYSIIPNSNIKTKASSWIQTQRDDTACWPKYACRVKDTAAVIYSGAYKVSEEEISDHENETKINETSYKPSQCEGLPCTTLEGCEGKQDFFCQCEDIKGDDCPKGDIIEEGKVECKEGSSCASPDGCAGTCNAFGDCIDDPTDKCIPTSLSTGEEGAGYPSEEEREKKEGAGFFIWLLIILVILLIIIGIFFAYKKGLIKIKGAKKKPEVSERIVKYPVISTAYRPVIKREKIVPRRRSGFASKAIEQELDKSIKEMEKLLSKKKKEE